MIPDTPEVTYALIKSARSEVRSQSAESRSVRREPRLAWNALIELYGDEAILNRCIESMKAVPQDNIGELLKLCYQGGWRPNDL